MAIIFMSKGSVFHRKLFKINVFWIYQKMIRERKIIQPVNIKHEL